MPFEKGHKHGKGGKRKNAGRPTKEKAAAKKLAVEIAKEFIEKHIKPVLEAYKQLAGGRAVKHYNQQTGGWIYTDHEVDAPTLRHYIDKFVPEATKTVKIEAEFTVDDLILKAIERKRSGSRDR